ncbi:hypothetical protein [Actinoplanes sp. NPDC051851]|uniref:hypothetical protein n=1 Tax=Actinoplanes sp. NPDC051851 TaxID=3154753 RepID=UPI0034179380
MSRHPAPAAWVVRTALNVRVSWWRRRRREVALDGHDRQLGEAGTPTGTATSAPAMETVGFTLVEETGGAEDAPMNCRTIG